MTLTQLLRTHFDRTGEKQADFARRLGLTPQTVSQILRGDIKVPTADIRRKLAAEFNLKHVDILVMVGELIADEVPTEGAPRSLYPPGSQQARIAALIDGVPDRNLDGLEAYVLFLSGQPIPGAAEPHAAAART